MAQLRQRQDELSRLNTHVLVISFSTEYWARAWREETQSPFPLLLDPARNVYRVYGLERSYLRSWNWRTMWLYVRLLLAGRKWRGIQDDSAQLGGDFVVDTRGIVCLAYRSFDPADRPAVEVLLGVVSGLPGA